MCVLPICVSVHQVHAWVKSEEGIGSCGTGIRDT